MIRKQLHLCCGYALSGGVKVPCPRSRWWAEILDGHAQVVRTPAGDGKWSDGDALTEHKLRASGWMDAPASHGCCPECIEAGMEADLAALASRPAPPGKREGVS